MHRVMKFTGWEKSATPEVSSSVVNKQFELLFSSTFNSTVLHWEPAEWDVDCCISFSLHTADVKGIIQTVVGEKPISRAVISVLTEQKDLHAGSV